MAIFLKKWRDRIKGLTHTSPLRYEASLRRSQGEIPGILSIFIHNKLSDQQKSYSSLITTLITTVTTAALSSRKARSDLRGLLEQLP